MIKYVICMYINIYICKIKWMIKESAHKRGLIFAGVIFRRE